jgi:uncharacterized protein (TIGR03086 family)
MSQEIVDRVTSLVNSFDARVQAAPSDGWGAPAPCADWTARDVVVHVGNNLGGMAAGLTGQTPTPIADDDDIVDAWTTRRDAFFAAVQTADLNTVVPGPMGPMPAAQVIGRLISMDVLVHTWDLALRLFEGTRLSLPAARGVVLLLQGHTRDGAARRYLFVDATGAPVWAATAKEMKHLRGASR